MMALKREYQETLQVIIIIIRLGTFLDSILNFLMGK